MSKERMMILEMVESGKITPADAQVLFRALGEDEPGDQLPAQRDSERGTRPGPVQDRHDPDGEPQEAEDLEPLPPFGIGLAGGRDRPGDDETK